MQRRHLLLAILTASTLGACGFRLKGTGGGTITLDAPLRLTLPAQEKDNARVIREVFCRTRPHLRRHGRRRLRNHPRRIRRHPL